jgi:hypothetical protein
MCRSAVDVRSLSLVAYQRKLMPLILATASGDEAVHPIVNRAREAMSCSFRRVRFGERQSSAQPV